MDSEDFPFPLCPFSSHFKGLYEIYQNLSMVKLGDFVFLKKNAQEKHMDPNKSHPLQNRFLLGNWIHFNDASLLPVLSHTHTHTLFLPLTHTINYLCEQLFCH